MTKELQELAEKLTAIRQEEKSKWINHYSSKGQSNEKYDYDAYRKSIAVLEEQEREIASYQAKTIPHLTDFIPEIAMKACDAIVLLKQLQANKKHIQELCESSSRRGRYDNDMYQSKEVEAYLIKLSKEIIKISSAIRRFQKESIYE